MINLTSMDESVDEEEEEELSEEEEMTVNHFVQELEKMKLRTNKEIPLEEYMRTTFLHLIQKSATITGTTLPLLIHLRDALDISRTEVGSIAIRSLLYAIQDYRIQGGQVALIANCTPTLLFSVDVDIQYLFGISGIIWESFILMRAPDAPVTDEGIDLPLLQEEWRRIQISEINQRNLQRTLRQRHVDYDLSDLYQMVPESNLEIWTFDKIIRIVNAAIGLMKLSKATHVTSSSIAEALTIINSNLNYLNTELSDVEEKEQDGPIVRDDLDEHEKKLLGCIVNTNVMKTTFRDVVAPPAAIRTLQTLITLPLLYPKHFSYGVLSDHSISGVLLFGPPGTGKTMLARAVATESGSSMLEIKGSDINDKYVGESEKNVGAIFSLARKMAPCVIFIDEVDALFSARSSSANDVSKRETINQFMAEWDGLRSSALNRGITVLCATNRPFDLDDAVLRRMPRRILGKLSVYF
jgi:ATP-dependent 26S proteasome regulatory subunit